MPTNYFVIPKDEVSLLEVMMEEQCGNAHISFEGNLRKCNFSQIPGASPNETEILKRITFFPRQGFIVLPLEKESVQPILDQVLPVIRSTVDIIHIQIEKNNRLEFGAYDNFHPKCVACSEKIPEEFFQSLVDKGIIKSYSLVEEPETSKKARKE